VVIPTYHRYEPLEQTVKDLLNQTVPPKQIIVVDNTALDERSEPEYFRSTPVTECLYVSSAREGRVNVARNEGLAEVTSTFVLYFDDDMSIESDCIERILTAHGEGWDGVTGTIFEHGRTLDASEISPNRALWSILRTQHGANRGTTIGVPSCLISVRTAILRMIGGFDDAYIYNYDDYDLGIRLWKAGCIVLRDSRVSVNHLKVPTGGGRVNSAAERRLNSITAKYYFLHKHFNKRATRLELVADFLCLIADMRKTPIKLVREISMLRKGYSRYPAYGRSKGITKTEPHQQVIET